MSELRKVFGTLLQGLSVCIDLDDLPPIFQLLEEYTGTRCPPDELRSIERQMKELEHEETRNWILRCNHKLDADELVIRFEAFADDVGAVDLNIDTNDPALAKLLDAKFLEWHPEFGDGEQA